MSMKYLRMIFVAAALLGGSYSAQAAVILQVNADGILTGATGVDVGGTLYDVTFQDGSCITLFSDCGGQAQGLLPFAFSTSGGAVAASAALLEQVFLDGLQGDFDSNLPLTFGCKSATFTCNAFTPYTVVVSADGTTTSVRSVAAYNGGDVPPFSAFDGVVNEDARDATDFDTSVGGVSGNESFVWAVWLQTSSTVPEPTTTAILGLGLAAMGAMRRRRKPA